MVREDLEDYTFISKFFFQDECPTCQVIMKSDGPMIGKICEDDHKEKPTSIFPPELEADVFDDKDYINFKDPEEKNHFPFICLKRYIILDEVVKRTEENAKTHKEAVSHDVIVAAINRRFEKIKQELSVWCSKGLDESYEEVEYINIFGRKIKKKHYLKMKRRILGHD